MAPVTHRAFLLAGVILVGCARGATGSLPATFKAPPEGYSLSVDQSDWNDGYSVFHLAVADQFGQIGSAFAASQDPRLRPLTRLDTYWNSVTPVGALPMRMGDGVSSAAFGNEPARMGGFQIGTLQPGAPEVVSPPAIIDQPVEGAGPASRAAGRFIEHLRVLVQVQRQALVSPGQSDFSVESGRLRENFEVRSNDYGPWITSGTYRYGINASTTVDGQIAQVAGQQNFLGVGVVEGLGQFGLFSARLAGSRDPDSSGWLARMGYDYSHDRVSIALRSHIQTPGYQAVGDTAAIEYFHQRTLASARLDLGSLGKISVASATQSSVDESRRDLVALSHAVRLSGGGIVSTAAAYAPGTVGNAALFLSFTYPFNFVPGPGLRTDSAVNAALDRSVAGAFGEPRQPKRLFNE